eukprot:sb/3471866/
MPHYSTRICWINPVGLTGRGRPSRPVRSIELACPDCSCSPARRPLSKPSPDVPVIYLSHFQDRTNKNKAPKNRTERAVQTAYFFAPALVADLVVFPDPSPLVTLLTTPTATVCFMSRTANRPRGAYSLKVSTTMGLVGFNTHMEASPFFTLLGFSSMIFPDRLSILALISVNLQAM